MKRLIAFLPALTLLLAASWSAQRAEASISLTLDNGLGGTLSSSNPNPPSSFGTPTSIAGGTYFAAQGSTGSVTVSLLGATQKIGATTSQTDSATIQLTNSSNSTEVLTLTTVAGGFNVPASGPVLITDSFGTSNVDSGSSVAFVATVQGNAPLATLTLTGAGQSTTTPDPVTLVGSVSDPYSVTQTITLTLLAGASANFMATTTLAAAVPEPATLASALMGVGLFGGAAWLRRRRKVD